MMTGLAGLSTITNYSAVYLFNYFHLVGAVFEPIAKLSLSLTCFLLFIDALVLFLAMLLFRAKKAKCCDVSDAYCFGEKIIWGRMVADLLLCFFRLPFNFRIRY